MPRSGVPYRAYFFTTTEVQWFDATGLEQSGTVPNWLGFEPPWSHFHKIADVWPGLDSVTEALPVSDTVLRVGKNTSGVSQYLDLAKGSLVPEPFGSDAGQYASSAGVSWDVGPIVLSRNPGHMATTVDMRNGSKTQPFSFPYDLTSPMVAIPGMDLMWFTKPGRVSTPKDADADITSYLGGIEFDGPLSGPIVATAVMYGAWDKPTWAEATDALSDSDIRQIMDQMWWVIGKPQESFAVLYLLSGLRPAAYHPEGYYGLAQLSKDQLVKAHWTHPAEEFLAREVPDQISALTTYVFTISQGFQPAELLALLLTGKLAPGYRTDATVVASAPLSTRLSAFAAVSPAGVPADVVTLGDLRRAISDVVGGPLGWELTQRAVECMPPGYPPSGSGVVNPI